ncbi:hypothetical protein K443DRAFT_112609 [Laccaria amethystina LaAM-08-1]|uniref:Uncharacterized protein n=1 Tax=Laccaria amethystina LaAM-08-1 TaxID=1095629 RepID=A0A0C9X9W4_9AGAR|nr:hypothetical protein K443DRAFT_112609 [Laccaria amethystina LaAM-08-1]
MVYRKILPDMKLATIRLYEKNLLSLDDILDCCGLSERTFWRVHKPFQETGDVEPPTCTTRGRPKLHFDDITYLLALVHQRPDWFLDELLNLLDTNRFVSVHYMTIHWELEHAGVSVKKLRNIAKERNEDLRADFIRQMGQYNAEEIGFLNEFSKDERTIQRRLSGEGLLTLDGIIASTVVEGSMTREKFLYFLKHTVVSTAFSSLEINRSDMAAHYLLDAFDIAVPWETQ